MAGKDILLKAGIKFDPKEVDVKAIKQAIAKAITETQVSMAKLAIGTKAKAQVKEDFQRIAFQVATFKASPFSGTAKKNLQDGFSTIPFKVQNVVLGSQGKASLQNSMSKINLKVEKAKVTSGAQRQVSEGLTGKGTGNASSIAKINKEAAASAKTASDRFREQALATEQLRATVSKAELAQHNYNQLMVQGAQNLNTFGAKIAQIVTRFTAYLVSLKAIFLVQQAFNKSLEVIVSFDNAIQDLNKVIRATPEELQKVSGALIHLAQNTGQSIEAAAGSFGFFRRAISDTEEALRRAETAMIAANITELNVADATKLIASAFVVFNKEIKTGIDALDILSVTADNAATTAGEIARGILVSGAAAEAVGISYKQLSAVIASATEATQLSGSRIGSAIKTIVARLETNADAVRELGNQYGAQIARGDGFLTVIKKLNAIWPSLNKNQKANVSQVISGKRRFTEFNAIVATVPKTLELMDKQMQSAGTAIDK